MGLWNETRDGEKLKEHVQKTLKDSSNTINIDADFIDGQVDEVDKPEVDQRVAGSVEHKGYIVAPVLRIERRDVDNITVVGCTPFIALVDGLSHTSTEWKITPGTGSSIYFKAEHPDDFRSIVLPSHTNLSVSCRYLSGMFASDWSNTISGLDTGTTYNYSYLYSSMYDGGAEVKKKLDRLEINILTNYVGVDESKDVEYYVTNSEDEILVDKTVDTSIGKRHSITSSSTYKSIAIDKEKLETGVHKLYTRYIIKEGLKAPWRKTEIHIDTQNYSQVPLLSTNTTYGSAMACAVSDNFFIWSVNKDFRRAGTAATEDTIRCLKECYDEGTIGFNGQYTAIQLPANRNNIEGNYVTYLTESGEPDAININGSYKTPVLCLGGRKLTSPPSPPTPWSTTVSYDGIMDPIQDITISTQDKNLLGYYNTWIHNLPGTKYFIQVGGIFLNTSTIDGSDSVIIWDSSIDTTTGVITITKAKPGYDAFIRRPTYAMGGCVISPNKFLVTGGLDLGYVTAFGSTNNNKVASQETYLIEVNLQSDDVSGVANQYVSTSVKRMAPLPMGLAYHQQVYIGGTEVLLIGGEVAYNREETLYDSREYTMHRSTDILRFNYVTGECKLVGRLRAGRSRHVVIPRRYVSYGAVGAVHISDTIDYLLIVGGNEDEQIDPTTGVDILQWA